MNYALGRGHTLTWRQIACFGSDRISKSPRENVYALLIVGMAVWGRNVRAWWHGQFKYADIPGVRAIDEVVDSKLPDFDFRCTHEIPLMVALVHPTCDA
jgi:hypothetical protein